MYKTWIAVAGLLSLAAGPALAQRDVDDDADNVEGLYLGAGLGEFSTKLEKPDDVDDVGLDLNDFDEDEDSSKFFAGWRFNQYVAVQFDYYDFGESRTARGLLDVSRDTKGLAPSIVGTLPLGPVELFARAGIVFYDVEVNFNNDPFIDESGEDAVYSAGIGLTLAERLNLRLEYEEIDISEFRDADAVWLSANWRF